VLAHGRIASGINDWAHGGFRFASRVVLAANPVGIERLLSDALHALIVGDTPLLPAEASALGGNVIETRTLEVSACA
jgi:hypothetical protein